MGPLRDIAASRRAPLRTPAARRRAAFSLPGRGRNREARMSPRRDDAGLEPAGGSDAWRARPVHRRRPLAERLRGRWGHRPRAGAADHGGRDRARPVRVPAVAVWARASGRSLRVRAVARGLSLLLPPAL